MRGALSAVGVGGLLALAGCATNTVALEEELSRLRREVRTLSEKVGDADLKLERLEGRVTLLGLGGGGEVAPAPKTPVVEKKKSEPKIAQLAGPQRALPVVKLSSSGDEDGSFDEGAMDDGSPPIVIKLGPSSSVGSDDGEDLPVDHGVLSKPDPVLDSSKRTRADTPKKATKAELKAAYEIAVAKLRIDGDSAAARKLLERFARRYPGSDYAANVEFWMGECDFSERSFPLAIKRWQKMIDAHPRSPKVPDAMVRQAEARIAIDETERAEALLAKVMAQYPDSDAATKAKALLKGSAGGK